MLSLKVWGDTCSCAKCFCGFFITSFNQFFISSISILVTPYIKISLLPSLSCSPILIGSSLLYIYTSAYSIYPNVAGVSIDKPACCRYTCLTFMHTRLDVLTYPVLPPCLSYILSTHWSTNCKYIRKYFLPKDFSLCVLRILHLWAVHYVSGLSWANIYIYYKTLHSSALRVDIQLLQSHHLSTEFLHQKVVGQICCRKSYSQ